MQTAEKVSERVIAASRIPADRRSEIVPCPTSMKIELTSRCNLRCKYCAQPARSGAATDMDEALFERICTDAVAAGVKEIGLFYLGEPFMSPQRLVESIGWLKGVLNVPYVFITSNAVLATPELFDACIEAGLDSIKWSFNSNCPHEWETKMGVPAEMRKRAIANIAAAWETRRIAMSRCRITASSIRYADEKQNEKMERALAKFVRPYVDEHYWLPMYSMGMAPGDVATQTGQAPTVGNRGVYGHEVDPLPCWALFTAAHVRVDGHMTACCFDSDGRWDMGDAGAGFMSAWNSEAFQELRKAHLAKDVHGAACESCIYGSQQKE